MVSVVPRNAVLALLANASIVLPVSYIQMSLRVKLYIVVIATIATMVNCLGNEVGKDRRIETKSPHVFVLNSHLRDTLPRFRHTCLFCDGRFI